MATRYAGKYRRGPCPQATIKTFNFLRYLSLGGRFGLPQDKFSFFAGGTTIFTGGVPPILPYFAHCSQSASNLFCRKKCENYSPPLLKISLCHYVYVYVHVFIYCVFLQCRVVQRMSMTGFRLESLPCR